MIDYALFFGTFLLSAGITIFVRRYAIAHEILDIPNERSSHHVSTPRGGGIAIVLSFYIGLYLIWLFHGIRSDYLMAILGAGWMVAIIGWLDDRYHTSMMQRIIVHFLAAGWIIYWIDAHLSINFLGYNIAGGIIGILITLIGIVWMLNLFNFMDGIDGIAASEAIFISLASCLIFSLQHHIQLVYISLLITVSCGGFLLLNWPPAKIFMGDVGSGFLGILTGLLFIMASAEGYNMITWTILTGVFIVDATYTLVVRFLTGEKWYVAHKSHAYQKSARIYGHRRVTVAVILINICWLFPLAILAEQVPGFSYVTLVVAYIPLVYFCLKYSAGIKSND